MFDAQGLSSCGSEKTLKIKDFLAFFIKIYLFLKSCDFFSGRRGRRFKSCRIDSLAGAPESLILKAFRFFFMSGNGCLESGEKRVRSNKVPTKF